MMSLFGCAAKENRSLYMVMLKADKPMRQRSTVPVGESREVYVEGKPEKPLISLFPARALRSRAGIKRIEVIPASRISPPVLLVGGTSATFKALEAGDVTLIFHTERGKHTTIVTIVPVE